jgi:hypothetical protein
MVRDNVTGLIWEVKHNKDGTPNYSDPNDADNIYCWGITSCPSASTTTENFITDLNTANYGGYSDWRLPTVKELSILLDRDRSMPSIDTDYFPYWWRDKDYWTSTTHAFHTNYAWYVNFHYYCYVSFANTTYGPNLYYVRAVRGVQTTNNFVDNGDGTVTDIDTGLMWQQASAPGGHVWEWEQALNYCENLSLAGYDDWRLPNINEIQSIVDYSLHDPPIDTTYFPDMEPLSVYWSSTTNYSIKISAWYVDFDILHGSVQYGYKSIAPTGLYVRAVRGGETETLIELSSFTVTPTNKEILLEWLTSAEIDNTGFNIYRADGDGEYAKINTTLIPAEGSPTEGASYKFIDKNVKNRKTYYYLLEDIDINGVATEHGPVSTTPRLLYWLRK